MGRRQHTNTKPRKILANKAGNAVPSTTTKIQPHTNISRHPKVYRPKQNYTTTVNKQGLSHTQGVHGAAYGVTQHADNRHIQQQNRTNTVNIVHRIRHVIGGGNVQKAHVPVTVKTDQAKHHTITKGTGVVKTGTRIINKKKYVRPQGAGQNPVYLNPFGLDEAAN